MARWRASLLYSRRTRVAGTSKITSLAPVMDGFTSKMIGTTMARPTGKLAGHKYGDSAFTELEYTPLVVGCAAYSSPLAVVSEKLLGSS